MTPADGLGAALAGGLGASIGSFLGVAAERIPKGEALGGRSHCVCGAPIKARDNLPIVGYLLRRGRARCCGATIPWWYLALEIGAAAVGVGIFWLLA